MRHELVAPLSSPKSEVHSLADLSSPPQNQQNRDGWLPPQVDTSTKKCEGITQSSKKKKKHNFLSINNKVMPITEPLTDVAKTRTQFSSQRDPKTLFSVKLPQIADRRTTEVDGEPLEATEYMQGSESKASFKNLRLPVKDQTEGKFSQQEHGDG